MKKVIIIYSTAGMGHKKAALALLKTFREKGEGLIEVKAIDLLEYSTRFYKFLYITFYIFVVQRAKWFWSMMYYTSNHPAIDILVRKIREWLDSKSLKMLREMLAEEAPDAIVATHFLLPGIASALKGTKGFKSMMYVVVTDYGPHSYWLSDHIDGYFVGAEYTLQEMVKRGVPAGKIVVTGIPTQEEFSSAFNTDEMRGKYDLDREKKTVFLLSGGFGVGPMEGILRSLNSCRADIQVITVCGHNKDAYRKIEALRSELNYRVILFGYTEKIAELMSVSDLMVTKAGGISVTEAMNMRLPMVLFASIPGQETWNEILLTRNGAAEKARRVEDIPVMADRILLSGEVLNSIKSGIDKIRRPDAAEKVTDIVMDRIRE
ncbi:MAG: glycosyltransferase [Candidatus Omnitrophota bacterium]